MIPTGLLPLVAGIGVVGLVVVIITSLTAQRPLVQISSLGLLAVSPFVFGGASSLDWVQKAAAAIVLALLLLRHGVRWSPAVVIAAVVLTLALLFSFLPITPDGATPPLVAVRAYVGFLLPWLFLLVRWPSGSAMSLLRAVSVLPVLAVPIGLVLQAAGIWGFVDAQDGTARLEGSSIPAHLAMMTCVGVLAAALQLVLSDKPGEAAIWLLLNLAIAAATLTRGALLAESVVVLGLGAWSLTQHAAWRPRARNLARCFPVLMIGLVLVALPGLLSRSAGNAYEGAFNTSGREQAWPFYLGLVSDTPVLGRGLGFASIAQRLYAPLGVQNLDAPHNEYLHFIVDGGALLLIGYVLVVLVALVTAAREIGPGARLVLIAFAPALALYATTDNPFSTPQFMIPFAVVLSACAAFRGARPGSQEAVLVRDAHHGQALAEHPQQPATY